LEALEKRCDATKQVRQSLEEDNERMDLELKDAKAALAKITEGKGDFEGKLARVESECEGTRLGMKEAEKNFNRDKGDYRQDMENIKQMIKDQAKVLQREINVEEKKMKEGLDDLGVMEFNVCSLQTDITNMHKRIDIQKDQLKMTQKFVEKLEKEKRDIEGMYDKLRMDHDHQRLENQRLEMDNLQLQLQLAPEARAQYLAEAQQRDEGRPKQKPKKKAKKAKKTSEMEDGDYDDESEMMSESARGGRSTRQSGYDDEESPRPRRRSIDQRGGRSEKEMSVASARAARTYR